MQIKALVDEVNFKGTADAQALSAGSHFDPRRWACDDDELVHVNGKTYAFSSQWGGKGWHRAMAVLKEKFPQFKISYSPVS